MNADALEVVRIRYWIEDGPYRRMRFHTFTEGDTVTVDGSQGTWRIAGFMGSDNRIADLVRVDKKWTAATSTDVDNLRPVTA